MAETEVQVYFSGYVTVKVDTDDVEDAVVQARGIAYNMDIDVLAGQIKDTLKAWPEADCVG